MNGWLLGASLCICVQVRLFRVTFSGNGGMEQQWEATDAADSRAQYCIAAGHWAPAPPGPPLAVDGYVLCSVGCTSCGGRSVHGEVRRRVPECLGPVNTVTPGANDVPTPTIPVALPAYAVSGAAPPSTVHFFSRHHIPIFDGSTSSVAYHPLLDAVAMTCGWNDAVKAQVLIAKLHGPATELLLHVPTAQLGTYAVLVGILREYYSTSGMSSSTEWGGAPGGSLIHYPSQV